jgi:hypothetical protein
MPYSFWCSIGLTAFPVIGLMFCGPKKPQAEGMDRAFSPQALVAPSVLCLSCRDSRALSFLPQVFKADNRLSRGPYALFQTGFFLPVFHAELRAVVTERQQLVEREVT